MPLASIISPSKRLLCLLQVVRLDLALLCLLELESHSTVWAVGVREERRVVHDPVELHRLATTEGAPVWVGVRPLIPPLQRLRQLRTADSICASGRVERELRQTMVAVDLVIRVRATPSPARVGAPTEGARLLLPAVAGDICAPENHGYHSSSPSSARRSLAAYSVIASSYVGCTLGI